MRTVFLSAPIRGIVVGLHFLLAIASTSFAQSTQYDGDTVAAVRALEVESATRLTTEGEALYQTDRSKKDGFSYCRVSSGLAERGELRLAIREATKALFLGKRDYDHLVLAYANRDLARAYNFAGLLSRAREYAEQTIYQLSISRAARTTRSTQSVLAVASKILGDVAMRQGDTAEAIRHYELALAEASSRLRDFVRVSLANAHIAKGEYSRAAGLIESAAEVGGYAIQPFVLRAKGNLAIAQGRHEDAIRLYTAAIDELSGASNTYHRVWVLAGLARARNAAGDIAGSLEAYRRSLVDTELVRAEFRSEEFKSGFFGEFQQIYDEAISALVTAGKVDEALSVSERSRGRALLDFLRGRVDIAAGSQAISGSLGQPLTAKQIQAALPKGVAIVEYHVTPQETYAWKISKGSIKLVTVPTTRADLIQAAKAFRVAIRKRDSGVSDLAKRLYTQLIKPLKLKRSQAIIVVPHGALHYVPFQALIGPKDYLVKERAVSYAPSASSLVSIISRKSGVARAVLALGNPDLGSEKLDLPGAEREIAAIQQHFPETQAYLRKTATKTRLLADAPQNAYVHIAAHAEVDEIDPLYSVIRLASTEEVPGNLEAREVYNLDLSKTRQVVLSACDTGLGLISRGDEIWGFTRTFLSAGAASLLVTLWPVDDDSTATLMAAYYKALKTQSASQALRTAQLALINSGKSVYPAQWAAFNLVGDWR